MKLAASYFGCRFARHVKQDMRRLARLGFDRVIHTFSENDLCFYPETMCEIVAVSKDAGLEVLLDPWGVARVFGGEAFSRWIVEDPDLMQRGASGRPLGGACLNHPRLRERMREWIDAAGATGASQIFWDEPHWVPQGPSNPLGEVCVCEHCNRLAHRASHLKGLSRGMRSASRVAADRFRSYAITRLLKDLTRYAASQDLGSSICVLPKGEDHQPDLSWRDLAALPGVVEFGTDPYWQAFGHKTPEGRNNFIDENTHLAKDASQRAGIATMMWVQAFRIRADEEDGMLAGVRRLLAHAPDTIAIWGFEACAQMSCLACEDSARVWRKLVKLLRTGARR